MVRLVRRASPSVLTSILHDGSSAGLAGRFCCPDGCFRPAGMARPRLSRRVGAGSHGSGSDRRSSGWRLSLVSRRPVERAAFQGLHWGDEIRSPASLAPDDADVSEQEIEGALLPTGLGETGRTDAGTSARCAGSVPPSGSAASASRSREHRLGRYLGDSRAHRQTTPVLAYKATRWMATVAAG